MTIDDEAVREALLSLTPAQQIAVENLAGGSTHAVAAESAGVTRETVTRWITHHPGVREALDAYRVAMATEQANLVRSIRCRALAVVAEQLDGADLATAIAVLRALPMPAEPTHGAVTADGILLAELRDAESAAYSSEPPSDDPLALLDELSGDAARRRRSRALERLASAAAVD